MTHLTTVDYTHAGFFAGRDARGGVQESISLDHQACRRVLQIVQRRHACGLSLGSFTSFLAVELEERRCLLFKLLLDGG